jgi:hypothetical protein
MPLHDPDSHHTACSHAHAHAPPLPDGPTLERLWDLFTAIGRYWRTGGDPERMRSNWLVFVSNRLRTEPSYAHEYANAAAVLAALIAELGETAAYEKLFTDEAANTGEPKTPLARARQKVSNEFVALQLALGGFEAFGAKNYLGFIAGANIAGDLPYRPDAGGHA